MLSWAQFKDDLYNGLALLRKGALTAAVYSSQETDRLKFRYRFRAADRQLAEAYRALGKYGLMKLQSGHSDFTKEKEWSRLIEEVDAKRSERDKLMEEKKAFDREEKQDEP